MKTNFYILSLLLALGFNSSFAQPYKPCLDGEIIRWSAMGCLVIDGPYLSSFDIVAYGDTLFNGVAYKQLFIDWWYMASGADQDNTNWQNHISDVNYPLEYYMRESEDASKLYLYNSNLNVEFIVSDMNLQQGDTFQLVADYNFCCSGVVNTIVDSIYFEEGLKHVALSCLGYCYERSTFIESVGCDTWFFGISSPMVQIVNCFQNQTIFYKNNNNNVYSDHWYAFDFSQIPCSCNLGSGATEGYLENNTQLFVQREKIEVIFSDNVNVDIFVYDVYGKLCYNKNDVFDRKMFIPTTAFSNGIYIVDIIDRQTHQTISKKVMI